MQKAQSRTLLLERGIYEAPVLGPNGETIYFTVRRDHRVLRVEHVTNPAAARNVWRSLEDELERLDPQPRLQLVG